MTFLQFIAVAAFWIAMVLGMIAYSWFAAERQKVRRREYWINHLKFKRYIRALNSNREPAQ